MGNKAYAISIDEKMHKELKIRSAVQGVKLGELVKAFRLQMSRLGLKPG